MTSSEWTPVAEALRDRGLTNYAAAKRLKVSQATLASWLAGHTRPNLEYLPAIANLTGLSLWSVHRAFGYLPNDVASPLVGVIEVEDRQIELLERQRELLDEMQKWTTVSIDRAGFTPIARAVGLIQTLEIPIEITVRPNLKGREYPLASHTLIFIEAIDNSTSTKRIQALINEGPIGRHLAALGARWRTRPNQFAATRSSLVLEIPDYERDRTPNETFSVDEPRSFIFCGTPYAHAELMGAVVAEAIGYGFVNMRTKTNQLRDLSIDVTNSDLGHYMNLELKHMKDTPSIIDRRVTSCTYVGAADNRVLEDLATSHPQLHFVRVKTGKHMRSFGANFWDLTEESVLEFDTILDSAFEAIEPAQQTLVVMPDDLFELDQDSSSNDTDSRRALADRITDWTISSAESFVRRELRIEPNQMKSSLLRDGRTTRD